MPVASGVAALLNAQHGLVTARQLRELGMSDDAVRWQLDRAWRLVLPHVIHAGGSQLDPLQRIIAAGLFAGRDAVVTARAAAAWHGVTAAAGDGSIQVEVPASRNPRSTGFVVVRRTTRPDAHAWFRRGILIASPARAVLRAAAGAGPGDRCRAIVIEAVQRGVTTCAALRHELEAGPRQGSAGPRAALREAELGAWSVPEADLLRIVVDSRLPTPWGNPDLVAADGTRLPRPDCWFDEVALAVQVHSWRFHSDAADWDRTVCTDGIYAEYGIVVIAVTPAQIARDPRSVLGRIERAHAAAARRPRPSVTASRRLT